MTITQDHSQVVISAGTIILLQSCGALETAIGLDQDRAAGRQWGGQLAMADPAQRIRDASLDGLALVRARLAGDAEASRVLLGVRDQRLTLATVADWVTHLLRREFGDRTEEALAALAEVARGG